MAKLSKVRSRTSIGAVRSSASEDAIVGAAAKILDQQGFDGFTIDAVAREARASKPTIYRWWGTKIGLIQDAHARTRKVVDVAPNTGALRTDLIAFLTALWRQHWANESNARVTRALFAQALTRDDVYGKYRDEYVTKRAEPFLAAFDQAKKRGEIDPAFDVQMIWQTSLAVQLYRLAMRNPMSDAEIAGFVDLLLATVPVSSKSNGAG